MRQWPRRKFFAENELPIPDDGNTQDFEKSIKNNKNEARMLHIEGTPAIIINDDIIYGWDKGRFMNVLKSQ